MTSDQFVSELKKRKDYLERILRKEKDKNRKQTLIYKIEKLNIFITEFTVVDNYSK